MELFLQPIVAMPEAKPKVKQPNADSPASLSWPRRIWGGGLVLLGYLLSPLCWWNDVVFNLPLALGFGYLLSRAYPDALIPLTVVGYWLSNVAGFVLMQQGAVTALNRDTSDAPNHSLRNGLITSTLYTVVIVALLQLHILDTPDFLGEELSPTLTSMLPDWLPL